MDTVSADGGPEETDSPVFEGFTEIFWPRGSERLSDDIRGKGIIRIQNKPTN